MKKALSLLLSIVLTLGIFCGMPFTELPFKITAEAASSGSCGNNVTWSLDNNGTLTITGTGAMKDYSYYNTCSPWYSERHSIKCVKINNGVTSIGKYAFYNCSNLTSVIISDSVTNISDYAFYCCYDLTSITIPEGVTTICEEVFRNCRSLTSITISAGVTSIGDDAFVECKSLTAINVDSSNNSYTSVDGVLFNKGKTQIIQYPAGKTATSYTIPYSVTSVGRNTFNSCSSLTSVIIPYGVTGIGDYAFKSCTNLVSITIPDSVTGIGFGAFYACTGLTSIIISDCVTSIGSYAFNNCTSLASVTIPANVSTIGHSAFDGCTNLSEINVVSSNTSYASVDGVLFNKSKTKLVRYPIGKLTKSYIIPAGVTTIGDEAFYYCSSLASVTIPDGVTAIGDFAFYYCSSLTSVIIPDGVTNIGYSTFYSCTSLTDVTIPDSVTNINSNAFDRCSSLINIFYPSTSSDWGAISVGYGDSYLISAFKHYNVSADEAATHCNVSVITYPTCTTKGQSSYNCPCGYSYIADVETLAHNYSTTWTIDTPATCSTTGSKSHHCTRCDAKTDVTTISVDSTNHSYGEVFLAEQPTCTEYGVLHQVCTLCDDINVVSPGTVTVVDSSLYPESSHNYGNSISKTYNFSYPGADKLEITFSNSTKTESGYDYIYLYGSDGSQIGKYCGTQLAGQTFEIEGDSFSVKLTSDGSVTAYGFSFSEIIAYSSYYPQAFPLGHNYSTTWTVDTPATCATTGSKSHHCTRCDAKTDITAISVDSTNHSYGEVFLAEQPTCTEYGVLHQVCTLCDYINVVSPDTVTVVDSSEYPESPHSYSNNMSETYYFSYPGASKLEFTFSGSTETETNYDYIYIYGSDGSQIGKYHGTQLAGKTFEIEGDSFSIKLTSDYSNTRYGFSFSEIIAYSSDYPEALPLGHNYSTTWTIDTPATCTTTGSKSHHCTRCDAKTDITSIAINSSNHNYSTSWTIDTPATCTTAGSKSHHCTRCDAKTDITSIAINSSNHNYSTSWTFDTPATCTTAGSKSHHCTRCNAKKDVTSILATGHDYGSWVTTSSATCTTNGAKYRTCTVCSNKEYGTITSLGHDYSSTWTIDTFATCTAKGSKSHHCTRCDAKKDITEISINSTNHSYGQVFLAEQPTCTEYGVLHQVCTLCDYINVVSPGTVIVVDSSLYPESSHNYGNSISTTYNFSFPGADELEFTFSESTKTESNYDYIYLYGSNGALIGTYCGTQLAGETFRIDGNSFSIKLTTDGSVTEYGFSFSEIIAYSTDYPEATPLGHDYSTTWTIDTPATCTSTGSKSHHCTRCDEKRDVTTLSIDSTNHSYGEAFLAEQPTCTEYGELQQVCTLCDYINVVSQDIATVVDSSEYPESPHNYNSYMSEIYYFSYPGASKLKFTFSGYTETESNFDYIYIYGSDGSEIGKYSGTQLANLTFEVEGDSFSIKLTSDHSVTEYGFSFYEIIAYSSAYPEVRPLGHNYPTTWTIDTPATCTSTGSKSHHCTRCDIKSDITTVPIDNTRHNYSYSWTIDTVPTCASTGSKSHHCTRCDAKSDITTIAIDSSNHNFSSNWTIDIPSTCQSEGSKSHHCTRCDVKRDITVVNPIPHHFSDWEILKNATYTSYGQKVSTCDICHSTEYAIIPKLICAAPKLKKVSNTTNGVVITWGKVTGAKTYVVLRKSGSGSWEKIAQNVTSTSYTDKTAKSGKTYKYTVRAQSDGGLSNYNTTGFSIKRLTTPKLKRVTTTKAGVTFKWNKVTGAQGYVVYRKTGNGGWKKIATVKGSTKVTYLDRTAKKGITYKYTVKAYYGSTFSAYNTNGLKIKDKY